MGGGQRYMYPNYTDPEKYDRLDNRTLVEEWKQQRKDENKNSFYVTNKKELNDVKAENTDSLFGKLKNYLKYFTPFRKKSKVTFL